MPEVDVKDARAMLREQFTKFDGDKYGEGWADLVSIATSVWLCPEMRSGILSAFAPS